MMIKKPTVAFNKKKSTTTVIDPSLTPPPVVSVPLPHSPPPPPPSSLLSVPIVKPLTRKQKSKINLPLVHEPLENGIQLGGIFAESFNRIIRLEDIEKFHTEQIQFLEEDRDSYQRERLDLIALFKKNAASLSHTSLSHLESQQIIEVVRKEKENLEGKVNSLLSQRDWLDSERKQLLSKLSINEESFEKSLEKIKELEEIKSNQISENLLLQECIYQRDEQLESLKRKIFDRDEELNICRHSLQTKDRQLQLLVKERNRLKDENDVLKKNKHRPAMSLQPRQHSPTRSPSRRECNSDNEEKNTTPLSLKKNRNSSLQSSPAGIEKGFLSPSPYVSACEAIDVNNLLHILPSSKNGFDVKEQQYLSVIRALSKPFQSQSKSQSQSQTPNKSTTSISTPRKLTRKQSISSSSPACSKKLFSEKTSTTGIF